MHGVGFKLTIPVFDRVKTSHVLDRDATVIGCVQIVPFKSMISYDTPQPSWKCNVKQTEYQ
jgi:hypothetical protein